MWKKRGEGRDENGGEGEGGNWKKIGRKEKGSRPFEKLTFY